MAAAKKKREAGGEGVEERDADSDADGNSNAAAKRHRADMEGLAEEFVCPLTLELPLNPVMAEDGRTYERSEIEKLIRLRTRCEGGGIDGDGYGGGGGAEGRVEVRLELRSPVTNEPMGPRLVPAVGVRNAVEKLVRSGQIGGDVAERWERRLFEEEEVRSARRCAEGDGETGDVESMVRLGSWYYQGARGMPRDQTLAYKWYRRAADRGSVRGMAVVGSFLVIGVGVERSEVEGMSLLGMGVQGGSDYAAYHLGKWYSRGNHGLPRNIERAKFFLGMVVNAECAVRHLTIAYSDEAADLLRRIQKEELNSEDNA